MKIYPELSTNVKINLLVSTRLINCSLSLRTIRYTIFKANKAVYTLNDCAIVWHEGFEARKQEGEEE